jgi:hypothetical protein
MFIYYVKHVLYGYILYFNIVSTYSVTTGGSGTCTDRFRTVATSNSKTKGILQLYLLEC